ncbi:MAG: UDP-N-acetylmuramate dehydrogenase [Proteobacteria bacterium]|nr:UDP-N-acetylmuramate dehydrogenase [Pseudomonadota bacterium]
MTDMLKMTDLRPYNVWGTGGRARHLAEPTSVAELAQIIGAADEPVYVLGLGSNVLVADEDFDGTVIVTRKHLRVLTVTETGLVHAECGVAQPHLARFLARHDLAGGEFHAGIPGTVGGALAMNAGAFGGQTWDHVVEVDTIDSSGQLRTRPAQEFTVSYRCVQGLAPGEIFAAARLRLEPGCRADIEAATRALLQRRNLSQPIGSRSCGSVFINPTPLSAGKLIDECGLKGFRIGAAEVSDVHANFIVNTGDASAADILKVAIHVRAEVLRLRGQLLKTEFRYLGAGDSLPAALRAG